jgi:hypothetical protein
MALLFFNNSAAVAQSSSHSDRLPWVNEKFPPKQGNYEYVKSHGRGKTLSEASSTARNNFLLNLGNLAGATLDSKTKEELNMKLEANNNSFLHAESQATTHTFNIDHKPVTVSFFKVDEYYEYIRGEYHLWELYEVSQTGKSFKPYIPEYTNKYGFSAAWKSILLPGWGQFSKGQTGKGALFLASEAALVSSVIYFENKRANNFRKSQETTNLDIIKEYRNRADNWELYRNIAFGATAGVYLWNILDAALAKGKIRYAWIPDNLHLTTSNDNDVCYMGVSINF